MTATTGAPRCLELLADLLDAIIALIVDSEDEHVLERIDTLVDLRSGPP
jgi:hypothetical protein